MTEKAYKKKKNRLGLWIFMIVLLGAGGFLAWRFLLRPPSPTIEVGDLDLVPYEKGNLAASIYGTGTVQSFQTAVLTWKTSGTVEDVLVTLGQSVESDDVLVVLDEDSLPVDVLQSQIDIINIQNSLDDLYDNWESQLTQTKLDLLNAEEALEDLEDEREIMNYQRCTDERIQELEDELDQAELIYKFKQNSLTLQAVNTAQANLNYCLADYTEREIAEAELQVELAEARVADLEAQVEDLSDGPDPDQVTILETQLSIAESRLESKKIEAPFDGVVTDLSVQIGDIVQMGSPVMQIDDLSILHLDVQISEVDIPDVEVGQMADLVFDAYFNSTYQGKVVQIAPVGTSLQGVVEYTVQIEILDPDERIKPGMTAAVNIVVSEKDDIFLIPNDAIVMIDGEEHVYVQRGDGFEAVAVNLGSYSDFYSEVIDADIEEGEMIVVNPPAEITEEMPFGPPPGVRGGF